MGGGNDPQEGVRGRDAGVRLSASGRTELDGVTEFFELSNQ
jgi:hypothetical protein